jgi:hypothetical protein
VFTARYALSPYIKQIRSVFKGLNEWKTSAVLGVTDEVEKNASCGDHVCPSVCNVVSENKPFVEFSWNSVWAFFTKKKKLYSRRVWNYICICIRKQYDITKVNNAVDGSQWPRGLRRGSAADRMLGMRVRISPGGVEVCLSLVSVLCCQVEVSATDWSRWNTFYFSELTVLNVHDSTTVIMHVSAGRHLTPVSCCCYTYQHKRRADDHWSDCRTCAISRLWTLWGPEVTSCSGCTAAQETTMY